MLRHEDVTHTFGLCAFGLLSRMSSSSLCNLSPLEATGAGATTGFGFAFVTPVVGGVDTGVEATAAATTFSFFLGFSSLAAGGGAEEEAETNYLLEMQQL